MARFSYKENPEAVIDKLLEYHSIEDLRAIINRKVRRKARRGNNFFEVAVEVYIYQRWNDSKMTYAIDQISESKNISPKTIQNHITKFRNLMRSRYEELKGDPNFFIPDSIPFDTFLGGYIKHILKTRPHTMNRENLEDSYRDYIERYRDLDEIPF